MLLLVRRLMKLRRRGRRHVVVEEEPISFKSPIFEAGALPDIPNESSYSIAVTSLISSPDESEHGYEGEYDNEQLEPFDRDSGVFFVNDDSKYRRTGMNFNRLSVVSEHREEEEAEDVQYNARAEVHDAIREDDDVDMGADMERALA